MRIPNKLYSYEESQFPLFSVFIESLMGSPMRPVDLYKELGDLCSGVSDFTDVLDALFALGAVSFDPESGELSLVN